MECISKIYTKAKNYKKIHLVDLNRFCSFAVCFGRSDRDGGNRIAMRLQRAGRSAEKKE